MFEPVSMRGTSIINVAPASVAAFKEHTNIKFDQHKNSGVEHEAELTISEFLHMSPNLSTKLLIASYEKLWTRKVWTTFT